MAGPSDRALRLVAPGLTPVMGLLSLLIILEGETFELGAGIFSGTFEKAPLVLAPLVLITFYYNWTNPLPADKARAAKPSAVTNTGGPGDIEMVDRSGAAPSSQPADSDAPSSYKCWCKCELARKMFWVLHILFGAYTCFVGVALLRVGGFLDTLAGINIQDAEGFNEGALSDFHFGVYTACCINSEQGREDFLANNATQDCKLVNSAENTLCTHISKFRFLRLGLASDSDACNTVVSDLPLCVPQAAGDLNDLVAFRSAFPTIWHDKFDGIAIAMLIFGLLFLIFVEQVGVIFLIKRYRS
mmetsp:Transcript_20547/g.58500  ORF Transcript_20547/g.58500 Transcript_20547/m.58500 type:complete len:301 (-) Transcript_20547:50-952(-)